MSKLKVYEIEASVILRYSFEVDARTKDEAETAARTELEQQMVRISRDFYDTYEIDIEQVEESEGH